MISKKKVCLISLTTFLIPVIIFMLLMHFVLAQISLMGEDQRITKTLNYTALLEITTDNTTVFFGDSITELCPLEEIYGEYMKDTGISIINRGISGETTTTMLERIEDNAIKLQPRNLVMLMGVNDLSTNISLEEIAQNIKLMIEMTKQKSPQTHIILQAVYPINKSERHSFYEEFQIGNRNNQVIKELNQLLAQLAKDEEIDYLDVTMTLSDDTGELKAEYTYDGLHPNIAGYLAVREDIINALK